MVIFKKNVIISKRILISLRYSFLEIDKKTYLVLFFTSKMYKYRREVDEMKSNMATVYSC